MDDPKNGPDNIYIWIRPNAILISRGYGDEDAIRNLRTRYRKDTLVETYHILDYDGYFTSADVVLHNADESWIPEQYRHPVKKAIILDKKMQYTEREDDKHLEFDKDR